MAVLTQNTSYNSNPNNRTTDTFRLGKRTNAITATHNAIAKAKKHENLSVSNAQHNNSHSLV